MAGVNGQLLEGPGLGTRKIFQHLHVIQKKRTWKVEKERLPRLCFFFVKISLMYVIYKVKQKKKKVPKTCKELFIGFTFAAVTEGMVFYGWLTPYMVAPCVNSPK